MSREQIRISPYESQYEQAHIDFATRYWTKGRRKNPAYIYWKFRGSPGNCLPSFLLALVGDTVVGQLGLIPCELMVAGKKYDAQWACDLMVDTSFRGKGVARMLYDRAHSLKSITLGSDPSPAALSSMTRAGYNCFKGPAKYILPISLGETIRIKLPRFSLLKRFKNPFLWYFVYNVKAHSTDMISASWQECMEPINAHRMYLKEPYILHDEDFMQWRAEAFPSYYEAPRFVRHGDEKSYMCFKKAGNAFYINEWHAESPRIMSAFFGFLVLEALPLGIHFIKVLANSEREEGVLKQLGLLRFRSPTQIIYHYGALGEAPFTSFDRFYYTYWDSDEYL